MRLLLISCLTQVTIVSIVASLLYLLTSRRRPSERAAVIGTAVLAIGVVTALSFCPLPSWWSILPDATSVTDMGTSPATIATPEANAGERTSPNNAAERPRRDAVDRRLSLPIQWLRFFRPTADDPSVEESTASRTWPGTLLLAVAIGASAFLLRVAIGLRAIRRLYRQSQPLTNAKVDELLIRVQQLTPRPRSIAVRESPHPVAAATIGWRRPVIVLPADWVGWSADELLAVLAHEVAHICRRDYPMRLMAYVVAALHFYHPLIHWLTRRLVQEQELAADALAATLAGGRRRYLHALSRIALRQDGRPNVWPGSIALPVSSRFLMRRIEMLRAKDGSVRDSATKATQWVSVAAVVLFSVAATAIRSAAQKPDEADRTRVANRVVGRTTSRNAAIGPASQASSRVPDKDVFQRKPFDPSLFLAGKGSAILVVRPAELFRRNELRPLKDACNQILSEVAKSWGGTGQFPLKIEQIEFVAAHLGMILDYGGNGNVLMVHRPVMVRTTVPFDWKQFFVKAFPDTVEKEYRQHKYLELPAIGALHPKQKSRVYVPDDRMVLLVGSEETVQGAIARHVDGRARYDWGDQWAAIDGGLITVAFDNVLRFDTGKLQARWFLEWEEVRGGPVPVVPVFRGAELFCYHTEFICIGADWSDATDRFVVRGRAICRNWERPEDLKRAVGSNLKWHRAELENDKSPSEQQYKPIWRNILSFLQSASLQCGKTPDGQGVVDGRIETEVSVDQLLKSLGLDGGS